MKRNTIPKSDISVFSAPLTLLRLWNAKAIVARLHD